MKRLPLLCVLLGLLLPLELFAQSAAFRAQGRYYSAKDAYESGKFAEAARMCRESREFLEGRTNLRLQYLMVSALFRAGQFKEAQKEMERFFQIDGHDKDSGQWKDRGKLYREFPQEVDRLTADETKEMSKMIDKIDERVSSGAEEKALAIRNLDTAVAVLVASVNTDRVRDNCAYLLEGTPNRLDYTFTVEIATSYGKAFCMRKTSFSVKDLTAVVAVDDSWIQLQFARPRTLNLHWEALDPRVKGGTEPEKRDALELPTVRKSRKETKDLADMLMAALAASRR